MGGLSSLLEGVYNNTISKPPMDVGRTNFFQMDIPTVEPLLTQKQYPILLKHQKFVDKEIKC